MADPFVSAAYLKKSREEVLCAGQYPELAAVCRNSNTLILYPGAEAANLEEVALIFPSPSTIIIIDGTWSQAKDIFYKNSLFRLPKQPVHSTLLVTSSKPVQVLFHSAQPHVEPHTQLDCMNAHRATHESHRERQQLGRFLAYSVKGQQTLGLGLAMEEIPELKIFH
ncbi:DTW domain-containing protein 2 [Chelonia mydas]|uniref:tRNA-uridine aminocarboxypropyltransferase n=1 Tax=Chelonia mydas TaxID=8469 RepID=M7BRQ0_CHEMY|nr:DTW domain-containing protein 2 [Chelonia mydas]